MDFEELSLLDRVALVILPSLLSSPDMRKSLSGKTIIHEARQIAATFLETATPDEGNPCSPCTLSGDGTP